MKAIIPCDDRCMFAQGDDCDCECEGANHKQGFRLTATQRALVKTAAGRRIKPLTRNSPDYKLAVRLRRMRDKEGYTQREIALELGVSAPTVRRLIRRLEVTEEIWRNAPETSTWNPREKSFVA